MTVAPDTRVIVRLLRIAAVAAFVVLAVLPAAAGEVTGAGSTFVYPMLEQWAKACRDAMRIDLDYRAIGSGAGIQLVINKTVVFGATDMPLSAADVESNRLVQFPIVSGAVVPIVNLPGLVPGGLTLDGATIAEIFLGRIARWNDAAIARLNPGVALPDIPIRVVHRADGSGSTFIWTDYLAKVSAAWRRSVGANIVVPWPRGLAAKGSEGVANDVTRIAGAFGYVEFAYAARNGLDYARLVNRAGKIVAPTAAAFAAAAAGTDWSGAPDFRVVMTDAPGETSWPIAGSTFVLMRAAADNAAESASALKFFDWGYRNGKALAADLGYVPMPDDAVALVEKTWKQKIRTVAGKPVY